MQVLPFWNFLESSNRGWFNLDVEPACTEGQLYSRMVQVHNGKGDMEKQHSIPEGTLALGSTLDSTFILFFIYKNFLYSRFLLVICYIHISVYMSIPISQFIPPPSPLPPTFPPWCPYICSLHLCLYFCLANRFICTIFLDSTF